MKQATHSEREKFVALMIRNCPTATASTCQRLMRLGATYNRLCARPWPTNARKREIRDKIEAHAKVLGMGVWYPEPGNHSYSVALVKGESYIIAIPTS